MPRIPDNTELVVLPASQFGYSRVKQKHLTASEYTVVSLVVDCSGSVFDFAKELETCVKEVLKATSKSARADNLLIRTVAFANKQIEITGFTLLSDLSEAQFDNFYNQAQKQGIGSATSLFDTTLDATAAMNDFGESLTKQDYLCNGLLIIVTDGMDNASTYGPLQVKEKLDESKNQERLESLLSILVAVNVADPTAKSALEKFSREAGFTSYIEAGSATKNNLAKLANFISKSITSSSVALGSGQASQAILTI